MNHALRHLLSWLLPVAALLPGCTEQAPLSYRQTADVYGSPVTFTLQGMEPTRAQAAVETAITDMRFIAEVTDPIRPGPLGRTNQLLAAAGTFSANPSLLPLIGAARQLSRQSGGLFNPALGRLLDAWGFYRDPPQGPPPDNAQIAALVARHPSLDDVTVDGIRMSCRNGAVRLDFGDFGRGYALDTALARLREQGVDDASLTTRGAAARIGNGPATALDVFGADRTTVLATVHLQPDEAAYTVSSARRGYDYGGQYYHAILDPATGTPAQEVFAVTVIDRNLARAAAVATALFVAGPDRWQQAAATLGADRAMLIDAENTVHASTALAPRINLREQSHTIVVDGL